MRRCLEGVTTAASTHKAAIDVHKRTSSYIPFSVPSVLCQQRTARAVKVGEGGSSIL